VALVSVSLELVYRLLLPEQLSNTAWSLESLELFTVCWSFSLPGEEDCKDLDINCGGFKLSA
jgi:hypothetical protein